MTRTYNPGGTAVLTGVAAIQFVIRPTQQVGGSDYIGALYREWDVTGSATGSVAAPTGLTAVGGDAHVDLSWAASSGATGYRMKRSLANGGPYSVIGTSAGTAYIDNAVVNGTTYYYVVSATNSAGESANSTQASATPVAANQAPVITQGATAAVTMSEDGSPTAFSLTLNATDANGDTITWSVSTPAAHGTATASGTGTSKAIGYTPTANYNGADSFTVQVSDGNGGTDTITVNVTVQSVNDAPVVSLTAPTNGASFTAPATLTLTATASDVDGTISTVGFYNGATLIASDTTSPYSFVWTNVAVGSYSLTARATDNSGAVSTSAVVTITVTSGLPSPWQSLDIGNVGRAGSVTYSNGVYTVKGAGSAIGGTVDSLRYVYQLSSGDCDIKLRVASLTNTVTAAKAGVMIRESLNSNAREAGVWVTPSSGIIFTRRTSTGGTTSTTASTGKKAPYWVRLTRGTNSFSAYYGTNGTTWTKLGSTITISMSTNAYMGMAVCSGATNTLSTSTMDNVIAVP
jgi:regulation of enolase protein 1 (concanavalin A-like superfamily)